MPVAASNLARKLQIKPGMQTWILNAPPGYIDQLAPLPEGATISRNIKGSYAFMQFFASRKTEILESLPSLLKCAGENALVWIAYPKKTSGIHTDLNRDVVRETISKFGWHTVSIIAVDQAWAALRIRPGNE